MTLSNLTTRIGYPGTGAQTIFPYTFKVFAETDLIVTVTDSAGTSSVKTLNVDYTVSGVGIVTGGNVTFGTAPLSGSYVSIVRQLPLTQGTDYVENDPFPASAHENALDRLVMISQQLAENPLTVTLVNSATPSVLLGRRFKTGGTTTITNFLGGSVGQTISILSAHSVIITHNAAKIMLDGSANFSMVAGDTLTLTMFDLGIWQEVGRKH